VTALGQRTESAGIVATFSDLCNCILFLFVSLVVCLDVSRWLQGCLSHLKSSLGSIFRVGMYSRHVSAGLAVCSTLVFAV